MYPFSLARRGPTKPRDQDVYRGTSLIRNRAPPQDRHRAQVADFDIRSSAVHEGFWRKFMNRFGERRPLEKTKTRV